MIHVLHNKHDKKPKKSKFEYLSFLISNTMCHYIHFKMLINIFENSSDYFPVTNKLCDLYILIGVNSLRFSFTFILHNIDRLDRHRY